jgi:ADP-ribose pyrophosphatase YjhB (NUDIX family)
MFLWSNILVKEENDMTSTPVDPDAKKQAIEKPIKYSVAIILHDTKRQGKFLVVKRPNDDVDLGGEFGFPATTLQTGELIEDAAKRICREKLDCEGIPTRFLGAMYQERNGYDIFLMDLDVTLVGSKEPDVRTADTEHTAYVDQYWSDNPLDLMPSAKSGSCCSSIFLTDRGLLDRNKWVESLKGSGIVG